MKIISIVLLSVLAAFFYSVVWTFAFSLINAADDLLLLIGILLIGGLLGITVWFVIWAINKLRTFYKE